MCGVAGALVLEPERFQLTLSYLEVMRDAMAHRGPDGAGAWIAPSARAGLAHRRLAIIDLSPAAAQPMSAAAERLWITFNGEIYNHAEIRAELTRLGHRHWKTDHSDTEVILHAFLEWGIECVHRLRGMFAFAIWDDRSQELWLVRDRLGIKPLYYCMHHGRFVFASEIKALLTDRQLERRVDEESFFHYLSFLTCPAPATMFEGIRKVPAATWMRVTLDGAVREARYWDALTAAQHRGAIDEDEYARELLQGLEESVRLHAESDVPVGVFLSGGVDSSTNAVLFSKTVRSPVRTFSVGYEGENASYPNELAYARRVAASVGAEHHEVMLRPDDLMSFLPRMAHLQDEPIADPVCVPVYYVSKLARDNGVKVCQVGEGADELFCGYESWATALALQRMNRWPVPRIAKRAGLAALGACGQRNSFRYEWLRRGAEGVPIFWGGAEAFTETEKVKLLGQRLKGVFQGRTSWEALAPIRRRFDEHGGGDDLAWMTYVDLCFRLPELLLMRVDKMSMGVSLEGRVPFLDHRFVEFAVGVPSSLKFRNGRLKHLLKHAVRNLLPPEIIQRRKQGFGVPLREWITGALGREAHQVLERFCERTDLLDPVAVRELLARGDGNKTWYLLNFALWWDAYVAA
jgi:asparagine synthase (glutamine-hydrolysing)